MKTISLEIPQDIVDNIRNAPSVESWLENHHKQTDGIRIPDEFDPEAYANLVKAADKYGIKVLGHDSEELIGQDPYSKQDRWQEFLKESNPELLNGIEELNSQYDFKNMPGEKYAEHAEKLETLYDKAFESQDFKEEYFDFTDKLHEERAQWIRDRNEHSAEYINDNKAPDGKILVIAGEGHSEHEHIQEYALKGDQLQNPNNGLDKLLGVPSILVDDAVYDKEPAKEDIGKTTPLDEHNKVFDALLPKDLKKTLKNSGINSWPPPKHVEHADEKEAPLPKGAPADAMPELDDPFRGK